METFGRYSGISDVTDAQRLALDLTNYKPPLLVETTDNGTWKWLGGSAWVQTHSGGAALVSQSTLLAGEDPLNNVMRVEKQNGYELIAASTTAGVPGGGSGAIGDLLEAVIVKANTGTITILDGSTTVLVIPASTPVGTRYELNMLAKTAWKITTPASTEAICVGRFS